MLEFFNEWISPALWVVLQLAMVATAIMSLRWPGGAGAILFVVASSCGLLLTTFSSLNNYYDNITSSPLIRWTSPYYEALPIVYTVISALHICGLFLIITRFRAAMRRLGELETIASHGEFGTEGG